MNEALDNLNEAVMSGSKAEATNQAKTLVQVCESLTMFMSSFLLHPSILTWAFLLHMGLISVFHNRKLKRLQNT